ncbi:hypothetical protein OROMI_002237 [Orobanche minor]
MCFHSLVQLHRYSNSVGQRRLIFRNLHRMFHRTLQPQCVPRN